MTEPTRDPPLALGRLGRNRPIAGLACVLANAFRDNPLNRTVIASDDPQRRLRSNLYGMHALLPIAALHGSVWVAADGHEARDAAGERCLGGLIATPPGRFPLPPADFAARLRCLIGQGWRISRRWGEVFEALEGLHPLEPHWYLGTLGVDPGAQRRGVGSALLARWIEDVDRDGVPAYLETDRETNISFYERVGFRVEQRIAVLATPVWRMRRPASPAAHRY